MNEKPKLRDKIQFIPFSYLSRLISFLKKQRVQSLEQKITKIVDVEKFFTQACRNGVNNQPYQSNSTETIGDLVFGFFVVQVENNTYDLKVEIMRDRGSKPTNLKIIFFPESEFSGVDNFETNILYLDADDSGRSIYIPGRLIDTYKGSLPIKIENVTNLNTP